MNRGYSHSARDIESDLSEMKLDSRELAEQPEVF